MTRSMVAPKSGAMIPSMTKSATGADQPHSKRICQ